jgi:hypothetical protein
MVKKELEERFEKVVWYDDCYDGLIVVLIFICIVSWGIYLADSLLFNLLISAEIVLLITLFLFDSRKVYYRRMK